jgi:hypothetical protein
MHQDIVSATISHNIGLAESRKPFRPFVPVNDMAFHVREIHSVGQVVQEVAVKVLLVKHRAFIPDQISEITKSVPRKLGTLPVV